MNNKKLICKKCRQRVEKNSIYCPDCNPNQKTYDIDYKTAQNLKKDIRNNLSIDELIEKHKNIRKDIVNTYWAECHEMNSYRADLTPNAFKNILSNKEVLIKVKNIKVGDKVKILAKWSAGSLSTLRKKSIEGICIYKNKYFFTLQLEKFKESFNICKMLTDEIIIIEED